MPPAPVHAPPGDLPTLPSGTTVLERGWLSANNIVCVGEDGAAVVDTGYCAHAAQTVSLVGAALQGRPLTLIANTHLHSDHCGGNAALQQAWPAARTLVPPGQAAHVRDWNPQALSYTPTGQECPPFRLDGLLEPGRTVRLGALGPWTLGRVGGPDMDLRVDDLHLLSWRQPKAVRESPAISHMPKPHRA